MRHVERVVDDLRDDLGDVEQRSIGRIRWLAVFLEREMANRSERIVGVAPAFRIACEHCDVIDGGNGGRSRPTNVEHGERTRDLSFRRQPGHQSPANVGDVPGDPRLVRDPGVHL